jgi:hypothetical protein
MLYASLTYAIRQGRTGGAWATAVMVAGVVALILQPPATRAGRGFDVLPGNNQR